VSKANLDEFLAGVDLYIDGLDFFAITPRCATLPPVRVWGTRGDSRPGMGAALLNFMPGRTFEEYWLDGLSKRSGTFSSGLSPAMLQRATSPIAGRLIWRHTGGCQPSWPVSCAGSLRRKR
jgi:hypothetical protein